MNNTHDIQAEIACKLSDIQRRYFSFAPDDERRRVRLATLDLLALLPANDANPTVLCAYGGGKDSTYMVGFLRMVQILARQDFGRDFQLRVATNRHAGMPAAVMANIARCFEVLGMVDDPGVELLLVDGAAVVKFTDDLPQPYDVRCKNRDDVLMNGHRFGGDARPTFCNACNASMVASFGLAAGHNGGSDVFVTGDSRREQVAYLAWIRQTERDFGMDGAAIRGLNDLVDKVAGINSQYEALVHGDGQLPHASVGAIQHRQPALFSIYQYTDYACHSHWPLLTSFLGFQFDDLAFSFTESDCANPAIMCHLRGLKAERLWGRGYAAGVAEYSRFALSLMKSKDYPDSLIDVMRVRYESPEAINHMRDAAAKFASDAYGLSEAHLVAILYSPFTDEGLNLAAWFESEVPHLKLAASRIREALAGCADLPPAVLRALTDACGLRLEQMRYLWSVRKEPNPAQGRTNSPLGTILPRDPHTALITTRHSPDGAPVFELISGR